MDIATLDWPEKMQGTSTAAYFDAAIVPTKICSRLAPWAIFTTPYFLCNLPMGPIS